MSTLERAIAIASEAHAGAVDKGGAPYILHPLRVMLRMENDAARIAAVLHDVVEDAEGWTLDRLRAEGFAQEIVQAVKALTRRDGEGYFDFCRRAGRDPVARLVKLGDIEDNMDLNRIPRPTADDHARLERYQRARELLLG